MSSKDDVARAPEWPVYHWDRVVDRDDHGEIARSGAIKNNKIWVDAKPVEEVDAIKKLKADKQLAIKRRKEEDGKKGGRRTREKSRCKKRRKKKTRRKRKKRRKKKKKKTKRRR